MILKLICLAVGCVHGLVLWSFLSAILDAWEEDE